MTILLCISYLPCLLSTNIREGMFKSFKYSEKLKKIGPPLSLLSIPFLANSALLKLA